MPTYTNYCISSSHITMALLLPPQDTKNIYINMHFTTKISSVNSSKVTALPLSHSPRTLRRRVLLNLQSFSFLPFLGVNTSSWFPRERIPENI